MERRPWLLLGPVFLYVHLRGFRGVVRRMMRVAVGDMRVVRCLLVVPLVVMCRSFFVMGSSMLMMFGCLTVMFSRFLGHVQPPFSSSCLCISLPRKVSMKPVSVGALEIERPVEALDEGVRWRCPADGWWLPLHPYIYAEGLTTGCGGGNYCPASNVTRWQMAVFLAIAMAGSGAAVPPSGTVPLVGSYNCALGGNSLFGDVLPTDSGCRFIHYIYANGVTAGCGGGNYCPASIVTRWQMAVFLVNAFHMPFLH
jgi:hypothetical protein